MVLAGPAIVTPTSFLRRFLSSSSVLVVGSGAFFVLGFAQNVLLARTLGTAGFGAWAVVAAVWFLLHALFTQGAEEALLRELSERQPAASPAQLRDVLAGGVRVALTTRGLCALLLVALSFLLPAFTDQSEAVQLAMRIQAVTVMVDAVEPFWRCVMRDRRRFVALALQPALTLVGVLGLLIPAAAAGVLTVPVVALCVLLASFARSLVLVTMLRRALYRAYGVSGVLGRALAFWRHPLAVSAAYWQGVRLGLLSNFFAAATRQGDVLILMWFVGDSHLGLYRIARMMAEYVLQAVRLLGLAAFGDMLRLVQEDRLPELVTFLRHTSLITGALAVTAGTVLFLLVDEILTLFYGPAFAEAALVLKILVPSLMLSVTLFWTTELVYALGRLHFYAAVMAGLLVVFVAAGVVLSMTFGVVGMAVTASVTTAAATLLTVRHLALELKRR